MRKNILKNSYLLVAALFVTACGLSSVRQEPRFYHTFIIWYDNSVGKKPLLKAAEKKHATVVYDYKNFSGIALRTPIETSIEDTKAYFESVRGVISVQTDHKISLNQQ